MWHCYRQKSVRLVVPLRNRFLRTLDFIFARYADRRIVATYFATFVIVAHEKINKAPVLLEVNGFGHGRTAAVPSNQSCVSVDDENCEQMRAILRTQNRGGISGKQA